MKLTKLALIGLVSVSGLVSYGLNASAADSATSDAELEYTKKTGTTPPVHPIKPEPVVPIDPPTGNVGELTIDYISNIKFGKHQIANKDMVYQAKLTKVTTSDGVEEEVPNYVQVTDDRGSLAGWSLKVKQNDAFKSGAATLTNTTLTFKNGIAKSSNTSDVIYAPISTETVLTPSGDNQLIVDAKANQGMGTWRTRFGDNNAEGVESIELMVPWNSAKTEGTYKTSLTWELGNTPD
ncbi:WxL domain-containing protein [Carnobacterium gallinarum]|uniref:WxL domain-containing protein n=1 Tax=Carnobacterium gallinarum TaxID=2749 RepID=UPI000551751F|nr:WxL domain-containing protein [Carnobacterium gallinarum]